MNVLLRAPAGNPARDRDLIRAHVRILVLSRDLDHVLALARTRDLDLDLDFNFDLVLACDLDRALALAIALGQGLGRVLHLVGEDDRGLDHVLALARGLDRALAVARDRARVISLNSDLLSRLDSACHRSVRLALNLEVLVAGGAAAGRRHPVRVVGCAQWLVRLALWVIPVGERVRYGEEWRGELWDLAAGPGRRRRQTAHALRTLACAWPVRSGVRAGRRRIAGRG